MTKEIRVGKVAGMSSYELAIASGAFKGTLSEYINKEQQTYNDMVTYGNTIKEEVESLVHPRYNFTTASTEVQYVMTNVETELFYTKMEYGVYASLSAFVVLEAETPVNDGIMSVYVNDSLVFAASIVNNAVNLNTNLNLNKNDQVSIRMKQNSSVNRAVVNSAFSMLTFERS